MKKAKKYHSIINELLKVQGETVIEEERRDVIIKCYAQNSSNNTDVLFDPFIQLREFDYEKNNSSW